MSDNHSKNQSWLEVWSFQPHPLFSGKGRETGNGVSGQSWPCDEATVKIPNVHVVWNLPVWWHVEVLGECTRERAWTSPTHSPCISSIWCSPISNFMSFYNKPVNVTVPKFCEPFYQIIEPKEEVVGTHIYSGWVRNTGDDMRLETGIWSWQHGISLVGTELLTCESWCHLQVDTEFEFWDIQLVS